MNMECFHNLDIDVINAKINALHHSAHLFVERTEVINKLHSLILIFAVFTDVSQLKYRKLAGSSTQKNPSYRLPIEEHPDVQHGFVENVCELFDLKKDCER